MPTDTHCHLNLVEYFPNAIEEIELAYHEGVHTLIIVGTDVESSKRAVELAESYERVFAVVGVHPNSAATYRAAEGVAIAALLPHPKVVAIGEIGLDYHWDYATREQQFTALYDQLEIARAHAKPIVFHCREAYPDLLELLEGRERLPYLLHCFAGNADDAGRAVALDCYFGVDGPVSYKKADELRSVVRALPRNRIVIETDSPFLTPEPFRGKPNRPAFVRHVNAALAKVLSLSEDETAALTDANAQTFFRLPARDSM